MLLDRVKNYVDGFGRVVLRNLATHRKQLVCVAEHFVELFKLHCEDNQVLERVKAELSLITFGLQIDSSFELGDRFSWLDPHDPFCFVEAVLNLDLSV